jgi:sugar lactone lactonase YvrE
MKSFRLDSDHFTKMFDKFTISNGMAWNLNNTKINFNDSEGRKIYVFDYELKRGTKALSIKIDASGSFEVI